MIAVRLVDPEGVSLSAVHDFDHQDSPDLLTGLSGWTGGVGVRRETLDRLSHGSFPTPTTRTGRTLTLDMMFERDSVTELRGLARGISGLFVDGGYGTLTVTEDHEEASAEVTLDGDPKINVNVDAGYLTAQIPLFAPLPYLYSAWREGSLRPVSDGVGLVLPLFATPTGQDVLTFGSEIATEAYVRNDGNAPSYAVFEVQADAPGGFRVSAGEGHLTWPRPTFPDVPVLIDMSGSVSIGGVRQTHFASERKWAATPPHSTVIPTFELLQGGSGFASVRHRDTSI